MEAQKIIVHIPLNLKQWGGKKVIVSPEGRDLTKMDFAIRKDEKLLKALGRAYRWQKLLAHTSATELAEKEKINKSYLLRMMRLTLLSPRLIDAILNGQQPESLSLAVIEKPFSPIWSEQEKHFGLS